jgi:ABC-type glutathione transport system ATPase component
MSSANVGTADSGRHGAAGAPVLEVSALGVVYERRRPGLGLRRPPLIHALAPVSFALRRGECLGVVGESGSGKSSLGRAVLQMLAYAGTVRLGGAELGALRGEALAGARRRIQAVFQDPRESMNPRMRIGDIVAEPLRLAGVRKHQRHARAAELLDRVGLGARLLDLLPGQVSGGEAQRVAIARALAASPDVIVLDEPTSSLDVSTQALLLNLLKDLARTDGLSYILISHDIATVFYMADRLIVLREGRVVEAGVAGDLLAGAKSDYTKELIAAGASACRRRPEQTEELSS